MLTLFSTTDPPCVGDASYVDFLSLSKQRQFHFVSSKENLSICGTQVMELPGVRHYRLHILIFQVHHFDF